jgi:hypothetical protein
MRYEQNGISLWHGTPDAPAPEGEILASPSGRATGITITVAVQPIAARNTVEVRYRVNGGAPLRAQASLARTDVRANAQYFVASLPEFRVGETVEYSALCSCARRQVPGPEQAGKFVSSFRVVPAASLSATHPAVAMEARPGVLANLPKIAPVSLVSGAKASSPAVVTEGSAATGVTSIQPQTSARLTAPSASSLAGVGAPRAVPPTGAAATGAPSPQPFVTAAGTMPAVSLNKPIIELLNSSTADKQILNAQLNAVLKSALVSSATSTQQAVLAHLLQTLAPADFGADQNLSLRDFVTKHTTLPIDPAANQAAQAAIALLSPTTTVGALLGLNSAVSANPFLSGIAAQTNLGTLLSTSSDLSNAQLQTDFINRYISFQGTTRDFWTQLSQDAEFKTLVPQLQFTMQLGVLTLNNPALVTALQATYQPTSLRDLTKLDANALSQVITSQKIPVPDGISGSTDAEKLTNYVNGIVSLLQSAFPTDYVAKRLAASTDLTLQAVAKVLSNAPDIDLQSTNIDAYLKQNSAQALQNVPPDQVQTVTKALKSVQRVQRIAAANSDSSAVVTLLSAGLDSASKIVAIPRTAFLQRFSFALGGDSQTQAIYSAASHINAQALNVYRTVQSGLTEVSPRAIANPAFNLSEAIQKHPSWEELFGSITYCMCGECDSVLGAAAYFVDLLQFLRNSKKNAQCFTPLDVLIGATIGTNTVPGRRPDLPYINLDCQNTNTPLPYIDLVNEVLESFIHLSGKLDSSTAQNVSPDATATELSVNPEHTDDAAYAKLSTANYPIALPYDRFLDVARRYLRFLGGTRLQVIQSFETAQAPVDTAALIAAEVLGLSYEEFQLIANWDYMQSGSATLPPLFTLYGYASSTITRTVDSTTVTQSWEQWLSSVPEFLARTGLEFKDLVKMLETQFVNPGQAITLSSKKPCDITQTTITPLADTTLTNILPFIRLWWKLGWSMSDLDKVLRVFAPAGVNRGCLLALADLNKLQAQLNLPLPQLLSIWSNIDTDGPGSLYLTLFQNKAVLNPVDPKLALSGGDITPGATITDETPAILAALRISADDLNAIRTATGLVDTVTKVPLNLANLSQLYRYATFARALGLQIRDLISVITLTGINPFALAPGDPLPRPTMRFVEAAQTVMASPFSVAQLNYIYRAVAGPATAVGPLQADTDQLVMTVQTGLQKIAAANAYSPDPKGKLLRQKLGAVLQGAHLATVMDLVGGRTVYTASLAALPATAQALVSGVSYDSVNKLLQSYGALSDADKTNLLGLSSDTAYQAAVDSLYQQPRDILAQELPFVDASPALASSSTSDRYASVLQSLLKHLTDTQSRTLVQQSLSQALSLDSATIALLLNGAGSASPALLKSNRDVTQPAMSDFLDVRDGGLLATYFSDSALTTVLRTQIDATDQAGLLGQTVSNPGGARWQGKVLPEFSESYTFYVTVNDGVRLWVNDQLVIDQWSNQAASPRTSSPVNVTGGQLYEIRLDYCNSSATAGTVKLGWSSKSTSSNANVPIPQSALFPANTFQTLNRLYPIGMLLSEFGMKADEIAYLAAHPTDFQGIDPSNPASTVNFDLTGLPVDRSDAVLVDQKSPAYFDQWIRLNDLFGLRKSLPSGNVNLFDIFRAASASSNPTQLSGFVTDTVLAATGWDKGELAFLSGKSTVNAAVVGFGLSDADFVNAAGRNGTGLVRLKKCLDLSQRLGVSASQLFAWANLPPSASQANDIKNTVKAKFDDAAWLTVGKPLNNQIRDDSRAALVTYVLNMPTILAAGISDAHKLYEYFLIDVQMTSCMQTSRIVQASAAIQLFVQRCLLSLEVGSDPANDPTSVGPDAIDAAQWEWRKNYRVWQANRKVFLYPENWVDPTLRDDRTPFFEDLQNELQQGEVTAERAETAFRNYLTKLLEVSRLEICGFYWENDTDPTTGITHNVFHVFGRTFASPHIYYYRRRNNTTMTWSPWERVDADIQGDHPHLIPVVWNRRLYLFWPIFKEQATPAPTSGPSLPSKTLQVRFAWSEYRDEGWTKKQVTADALTPTGFNGYTDVFVPGDLFLKAIPSDPSLTMTVYKQNPMGLIGQVTFDGCSTAPAMQPYSSAVPVDVNMAGVPLPSGTYLQYMQAIKLMEANFLTLTTLVDSGFSIHTADGHLLPWYALADFPVFQQAPGALPPVVLTYPQEFLPNVETNVAPPFFYADATRTYLATETAPPFTTIFRDASSAMVPFTPDKLNPSSSSLSRISRLPIFDGQPAPVEPSNGVGPTTVVEGGGALSGPLAPWAGLLGSRQLVTFATHHHPHVCNFLKELNWKGIPGLLTLTNQEITNDPRVIQGFVLSTSATLAAGISTGVLRAQDQLYSPNVAPDLGPAPPNQTSYLFYNSTAGFYYASSLSPTALDDAFIGQVTTNATSVISVAGPSGYQAPTVFDIQYSPTTNVTLPYPEEDVDFSFAGAYSIYNWEVFFHIPLLMATQLSRNQQFEDGEKWFRYIFNPTSNSTDPIPSRYWNFLPFHENTEPERIEDLITALEYTGTDPELLAEKESFSQQIAAWEQTPFDPDLIARMRSVAYQKAVVMKYIDHHLAWGDSLYRQFTRDSVNEATLHYVLCQDILGDKPVIPPKQGALADETYHSLRTSSPGLDNFSDALVVMENLFPFSTDTTSTNGSNGSGMVAGVALVPYFCIPPNDILLSYWDTVAQRLYQIRHCQNIAGQFQELPLFAPPINPALLIQALAMGMDLTSALSDINAAVPFYRFAYMVPKALELCAEVRSLGASLLSALEKSDAEALSMLRAMQETALLKAMRNVKQQQLNEANSNLDALNDSLAVAQNRQQYYQSLLNAGLSSYERTQVSLLNQSLMFQALSQEAQIFGSEVAAVPDVSAGTDCICPVVTAEFGGRQLAAIANFVAGGLGMIATMDSSSANIAGLTGGWARRNQEWQFQLQNANLEITQISDQIKAANARVAAAQAELDNQDLQISNASDVESFLRNKFTNQALYDWMIGQVSSVYFQCYQMAYDLAKRAEACFIFERMPDLTSYAPFIQFGYWDSLKKGLLSGERLYQDLKRLEIAYMEQNQRDYEITKSISLLLLDPMALINLKETGQCTVQFPEALFDMDYPGHYLRRIKSLGVTIPCVVGPYTSINCTLTLAANKIRFNNTPADAKDYVKDSDNNFLTNFAAAESITTSSGQNDSGLFALNFNDERYLPFEGAGVISTWRLSVPQETNAFDFETISDVIFNLKYTARDGGESLRAIARAAAVLPPGSAPGATADGGAQSPLPRQTTLARAFSLRHEFPSDWYNFLHPPDSVPDQTMAINLTQDRFPFRYRGKKIQIYQIDMFLRFRDIFDPVKYTANGTPLGDYVATAVWLKLNIAPPGGGAIPLQLVSNAAVLAGVPYGTVPQLPSTFPPVPPPLGGLGAWKIVANGTDIARIAASLHTQVTSGENIYNRLVLEAIEDMFLVCQFASA